jgi:hypothetical protein
MLYNESGRSCTAFSDNAAQGRLSLAVPDFFRVFFQLPLKFLVLYKCTMGDRMGVYKTIAMDCFFGGII